MFALSFVALFMAINALWYIKIKVAVPVHENDVFLVQDLIGGDGLDLIKLYLAPVRTFWKGVPEGSQVSSVRLSTAKFFGLLFGVAYFHRYFFLILIVLNTVPGILYRTRLKKYHTVQSSDPYGTFD